MPKIVSRLFGSRDFCSTPPMLKLAEAQRKVLFTGCYKDEQLLKFISRGRGDVCEWDCLHSHHAELNLNSH